jgi:RimJ/RimL family protein N-acetyltransferase
MRASFETARLSLSLVRETDRENLVALERDPEVMRFLDGGRPTPDDGEGRRRILDASWRRK